MCSQNACSSGPGPGRQRRRGGARLAQHSARPVQRRIDVGQAFVRLLQAREAHAPAQGVAARLGAAGSALAPLLRITVQFSAAIRAVHANIEIQAAAVMHGQQEITHRLGVVQRQHFARGEEVAEALGHLLAREVDEAVVQPVLRERAGPERALALGDLVLVMREDQVAPAEMEVERLAQVRAAHRRAFDMPARPPRAPGTVPGRLARLGRLPQREVER
jgi:hypothetical protein